MSEATAIETDAPERYLVKNQAKCLGCGDVIVSQHRHDFVTCSCGALSVDGGQAYARRSFRKETDWQEQSVYADHPPIREEHHLEHSGMALRQVHPIGACYGEHCTIHAMSEHVLRSCEQLWYNDRMWRRCEHGADHPDPDEILTVDDVCEHICCRDQCCAGAYAALDEPAPTT